jgi:hypothetical protein
MAVAVQGGLPCSLRNSVCCRIRFGRDPPALLAQLSGRQVAAAITLLAHLIAKASAWRAVPDTTPMTTEVRGDE